MAAEEVFAFAGFTLEVAERRLSKDGGPVALAPKAFDLLVALVRRAGRLATKQELLEAVWPGSFVEEGILAVHVSALRKALGDSARPARVIETVARSGYRFVAPITRTVGTSAATAAPGGSENGSLDTLFPRAEQRSLPEVYELCGRGRSSLHAASIPEVAKAVEAFRAAADRDPSYAPALAGLALAHCARAAMHLALPADAYRDARASALRALAMDEASADALVALGTVLFFSEWDWRGAERSLLRALQVDPTHVQAWLTYGRLLDSLGRHREALGAKVKALEYDPDSPLVLLQIALSYWNQRKFDDAIAWAEKALAIDPRHLMAREFLVGAFWNKGEWDRWIAETIKHAEAFGMPPEALEPVRHAYDSGGRAEVVRYSLQHLRRAPQGAPSFQLALLSAEAGEIDAAFDYLDQAFDVRDPALVDLAVAPQWDRLRADARFEERVSRMRLEVAAR